MSRLENHTKHCEVCAAGYAEHCYEREAAQEFDELTAERETLRKRIEGIPDDDWQGMYNVAAKRAQVAEDALAAVRKAAALLDIYYHRQGCPYSMCNCGADANNKARRELLAALEGGK